MNGIYMERGDFELKCPYCLSDNVRITEHATTLVAGSGKDPNHHTLRCTCGSCELKFVANWKSDKYWYCDTEGFLLRGRPNCWESVRYGKEIDAEAEAFSVEPCVLCSTVRNEHASPDAWIAYDLRGGRMIRKGIDDPIKPHAYVEKWEMARAEKVVAPC